jgi:dimethylaniline monooxygenase (N-oxide forming)
VLSVRRGVHIAPQYLCGRPTDHLTLSRLGIRVPLTVQSATVALMVRVAQGHPARYCLPKPDHQLLCGPPTVSDSLLGKLRHGETTVKPGIERFCGDGVCFTDGSTELADAVIYYTGYKISFPFLDYSVAGADAKLIPLYQRVIPPALPGLHERDPPGTAATSRIPGVSGAGSSS